MDTPRDNLLIVVSRFVVRNPFDCYWANQSRWQKRITSFEVAIRCKCHLRHPRLLIADEPVRPKIDDFYRKCVLTGLYGIRDVDTVWRFPGDLRVGAIYGYLCNLMHFA